MIKLGKEYEGNKRIGTEPFRSFYVPFPVDAEIKYKRGIVDKYSSPCVIPLNGKWEIKEHSSPEEEFDIDEILDSKIDVPSAVELNGYGQIAYINFKYPLPYNPPYVPKENPTYHFRRFFEYKKDGDKCFLECEGIDSCFYVFLNGKFIGFSLISHSLSEFDISDVVKEGQNQIDILVLKYCSSTYIEDQDKFRFCGIIHDIYLLKRPLNFIRDFKIETVDEKSSFRVFNMGSAPFSATFRGAVYEVLPGGCAFIKIDNPIYWSDTNPFLYEILLSNGQEKILQRIGYRTVGIEDGIFKINGKHQKLFGVNRHESNPVTGPVVSIDDTYNDIRLIKECNANAIRTSHYPDIPEFYDLCDLLGVYVMDEADLESHGAVTAEGGYKLEPWMALANSGIYDDAVLEREKSLYERDKNHSCVVIWSLGNESSYGAMLYKGADYIHKADSRPIHYEGLWDIVNLKPDEYYTERVDIVSRMYPPYEWLEHGYLDDPKEKRPLVLCEYSHAMGNSSGDIKDYWEILLSNDRFVGAFVWEWCDHAVLKDGKLLYGGDSGEALHDGNFCIDGLVDPFRKFKSSTLEMKAVYGGKLKPSPKKDRIKKLCKLACKSPIKYEFNADTGALLSVCKNTKPNVFSSPLVLSYKRAKLDNELNDWNELHLVNDGTCALTSHIASGNVVKSSYVLTYEEKELAKFNLEYRFYDDCFDVVVSYDKKDEAMVRRVGVCFALPLNRNKEFTYFGYGPYESYIDKNLACEVGEYRQDVLNVVPPYLKPQECGSHYYSSDVELNDVKITADKPFSFSVLPYSKEELGSAKHDYDLPESDKVWVSLDVAMAGVGTHACGPALKKEYEIPNAGSTTFRIKIK